MPVFDAELVQKKKAMPYKFRGMTIREVPVGKKTKINPCTETYCEVFRYGDCPGESWACPEYRKFRSE